MLTIRFNDEAFEIAAHILNNTFNGGGGLKGLNVDIDTHVVLADGTTIEGGTFEVVGAEQRDPEDTEIRLKLRRFDEKAGVPVGQVFYCSWDTLIEVC